GLHAERRPRPRIRVGRDRPWLLSDVDRLKECKMSKMLGTVMLMLAVLPAGSAAQSLSTRWEELTASDFVSALQASRGTCLLPFGILEKHGPAGPLGTDLINVRFVTLRATKEEYAIVFPEYYVGQIFEARHQPGTIAYSSHLQLATH